jgi:hypothetical protein
VVKKVFGEHCISRWLTELSKVDGYFEKVGGERRAKRGKTN